MTQAAPFFRMEGVSKRYGGVRALEKADLDIHAGRIHAILGENGAGKSTLIKILAGVVAPDEGRMLLEGEPITFASPALANRAGVVCIFQELSLVPDGTTRFEREAGTGSTQPLTRGRPTISMATYLRLMEYNARTIVQGFSPP